MKPRLSWNVEMIELWDNPSASINRWNLTAISVSAAAGPTLMMAQAKSTQVARRHFRFMEKIPGTVAQTRTPGLETRLYIPIVIAYMDKDLRIGFQYWETVGMRFGDMNRECR